MSWANALDVSGPLRVLVAGGGAPGGEPGHPEAAASRVGPLADQAGLAQRGQRHGHRFLGHPAAGRDVPDDQRLIALADVRELTILRDEDDRIRGLPQIEAGSCRDGA